MRPLSTVNYFRHNKRKLLSNVTIIIVAICLVYIMECFIASITQSIYPLDATRFSYCSLIAATEAVPEIPKELLYSLENSENIESTVPVSVRQIVFSIPGSTTHTAVFGVNESDQAYINKKFKIQVLSGRTPSADTDEIALDENVAKNNKLQIGSQTALDKSHNLNKAYTVVGILQSDSHLSFDGSPSPGSSKLTFAERGQLIFPSEGRFAEAEAEVLSLKSQGLTVYTLSLYNRLFEKNNQTFQILDIMVVLAILVMVVCLVCSKYAQFFSRRSEIGTLSALGFTQKEIIKRTFFEVAATNIFGFIVGLSLAILLCKIFMANAFDAIGGAGVYLSAKGMAVALLAPILTTIFTLIPVYRLIKRVDAISIVEKG